jgi:hypothetical protein
MLSLGIGDVGRHYRNTYHLLNDKDKRLVRSLLKSIIFCILFGYAAIALKENEHSPYPAYVSDQTWPYITWLLEAVVVLVTGIAAALAFTLFDRIGAITPIEADIREIMKHNKREAQQLSGYNKYIRARTDFGLSGIMATTREGGVSKMQIDEGRMDSAVIALLDECEAGWSVDYMNSFINSDQEYYQAILRAVARGVKFRLMLMFPDENTPATQSRFKDYQIPHCSTIKDFVSYITPKYYHFDSLRRDAARLKKANGGTFDIRYYKDSLNFPLIIIEPQPAEGTNSETVAYTGFYAGVSSETMPYVEWRHGEFDMIKTFKRLFQKKWDACGGLSHIFKRNAPSS